MQNGNFLQPCLPSGCLQFGSPPCAVRPNVQHNARAGTARLCLPFQKPNLLGHKPRGPHRMYCNNLSERRSAEILRHNMVHSSQDQGVGLFHH